jgi:triacylglycerol lipase
MQLDRSWTALLQPENATDFFAGHEHIPLLLNPDSFNPETAWWFSELSRLVYIRDTDEPGGTAIPGTRASFLTGTGLEETAFLNKSGTKCSVIRCATRDIPPSVIVVFRGTHNLENWTSNLDTAPVAWDGPGLVHKGFRDAFNAVREPLDHLLTELSCPVYFTGHSLGAALATLAAVTYSPAAVYTFGSPMAGNSAFTAALQGTPGYRIVNSSDIVTQLPPPILGFCHTGECHTLSAQSPEKTNDSEDLLLRKLSDPAVYTALIHSWYTQLTTPVDYLSDHASVNYTAGIEREWLVYI